MITLFTGVPGSGKTAALVDLMLRSLNDRPIFVHFDPNAKRRPDQIPLHESLSIDHAPVLGSEWHTSVPDSCVLIIDEAQEVWRPRPAGSKVPDSITALEVHRHSGIDIYLTTQTPRLLDTNVRGLVGRHVHIRDLGFLGRWWYEWPEVAENCSTGWKNAPLKKRYRLPKRVFSLYKSATSHIKPVRSFPWMLFVLGGALLATSYLGWLAYGAVSSKMSPVASPAALTTSGVSTVLPAARASTQSPKSSGFNLAAFVPVVSAFPESAPAYDDLRVVTTMRRLVAGWCAGESCECRDNQGIVLDLPKGVCNEFVQKGRFDPYRVQPDDSNRESRFTSAQPKNDQL
jgi:zona occludens toxin